MRDRLSRSSISRFIRAACSPMMPRKRCCAGGSSAAGPRSVSMKPISDASGVRSSWLTLATKSARMRSTARSRVRSDSTTTARPPSAIGGSIGTTAACTSRGTGTGNVTSAVCVIPEANARSIAARRSGCRNTAGMSAPNAARAAELARRTLRSAASTISGSGRRSTTVPSVRRSCSTNADRAADATRQTLEIGAETLHSRQYRCAARHGFVRSDPAHAVRQQIEIARPAQREQQTPRSASHR